MSTTDNKIQILINIPATEATLISLVQDPQKLDDYINSHLKENYTRTRVTNAGDVIVTVLDEGTANQAINSSQFFGPCQKITLSNDRRPALILYGLTLNEIENSPSIKTELTNAGVTDWAENSRKNDSSSATNHSKKVIRLFCKDTITQFELLCSDVIVNGKQYTLKPPMSIKQCKTCHSLDHIEKSCTRQKLCSNCGGEYHGEKCPRAALCVNCPEGRNNHSSYYRGCQAFQEAEYHAIQNYKMILSKKTNITLEKQIEWEKKSKRCSSSSHNSSMLSSASNGSSYKELNNKTEALATQTNEAVTKVSELCSQIENLKLGESLAQIVKAQNTFTKQLEHIDNKFTTRLNKTENAIINMFETYIDNRSVTDQTQLKSIIRQQGIKNGLYATPLNEWALPNSAPIQQSNQFRFSQAHLQPPQQINQTQIQQHNQNYSTDMQS
jgi:hypothetical protein